MRAPSMADPSLVARCSTSLIALLVLSSSVPAPAQTPTPAHDHDNFACQPDGLARNKASGCQLLAQPIIDKLPDAPVFWHLTTFPTRRAADAAKRSGDAVVTADGRVWLSSIGSRSDTSARGKHVAAIGPLPMPKASAYRVEMYYVIMPPHQHTQVHTHPGPEAWYVLEGEQCLDTPAGVFRARRGAGSVAPPAGTAMQLTNSGTTMRRALYIVVHDTAQMWTTPSDWQPSGACAR